MRIRYELVTAAGARLADWPIQSQTPTYGDLIGLGPAGEWQVIRRHWRYEPDYQHAARPDERGLIHLQIVVQPVPLTPPPGRAP